MFPQWTLNTSSTPSEDVEKQFTSLIEQPAIAAFTILAQKQDQPLWSKLDGFSKNFQDLGSLTTTQLKQIRSILQDLAGTVTQFYQVLDSIAVGNYLSIRLNPARVRTAKETQKLTKLSNELLDKYLPSLLTIDAVTSFARLLVDLFISYQAKEDKLKGYATELNNL